MKTKMTKSQQRVAIARDAIKQIQLRVYSPTRGIYIGHEAFENGPLTKETSNNLKHCLVCQIGQALVSGIHLFNHQTVEVGPWSEAAARLVSKWFSRKTAFLMEAAFEVSMSEFINAGPYGSAMLRDTRTPVSKAFDLRLARARAFGKKHRNLAARSLAIWRNVIRNNGEFIP